MTAPHVDVLIVGAGLAGIGFAWHLQNKCSDRSYAIIEARDTIGGTWDLFRYPGIRSDSNMFVYSYSFRPWLDNRAIAPGELILEYLKDTARENGIDQHITYHSRLKTAHWSSADAIWTVEVENSQTGEISTRTCNWLQLCTGYYSYEQGYMPAFPGRDNFQGEIIHPQDWPADFDATGKRIVVIGSGATAVTLIPSLVERAAHVTMLQRSPTYIYARPAEDRIADIARKTLPESWAYKLIRRKGIFLERFGYKTARKDPGKVRDMIMEDARARLPEGYDVEKHFAPNYNPWDQRVCVSPDGDMFEAIKQGKASVVTDEIETFTKSGIRLKSGEELTADVIITATGLNMMLGGNAELSVDGTPVRIPETWIYKGMMLSGVPNLATVNGTLTASYTLRVELIAEYTCRLINQLSASGMRQATPTLPEPASDMPARPFVEGFNSGYLMRVMDTFPRQGAGPPWTNPQEFRENKQALASDTHTDIVFSNPAAAAHAAE